MAGAKSSANLYSLIQTAKANRLEPYAYLRHVFTELPKATSLADIEALLPMRVATSQRDLTTTHLMVDSHEQDALLPDGIFSVEALEKAVAASAD